MRERGGGERERGSKTRGGYGELGIGRERERKRDLQGKECKKES